ncbi:hypothetical protein ALC60_09015 [Trachymyrmex zeteki]|uniref:Uncharacterized protein n=1 Tax=Mycetomoellerius zeteki TaxID=64791 RepID=A0A151WVW3_9HYME|nr:hypothetical protein ALC60_09015 [Trachymyrmex zeteki]
MQNRRIGTVAKSLDEEGRADISLHETAVSSLSRKKRKKKERETREKGPVIQWIQEKSVLITRRDDKPGQKRSIVSVDITRSTRLVVIRYQQLQEEKKRNSTLMKVTTASTNDDFR